MSDRTPMPAAGGDGHKGAPDGVNIDHPGGRGIQGESGGGSYPDGHEDDDDDDVSDRGDAGPKPGARGPEPSGGGEHLRTGVMEGRTVAVDEASGVAAAEASGKTGVAGQRASDDEVPGAG